MFSTVELPLWALVVILGLAGASFLSHLFFPSVRWFFRRRMERAVERLNRRLERPIHPFRLMRRQDQVIRLIYDPQVMEAVTAYARAEGVPHNVAFEKATNYAREIVPGFSTATYFGFAIKVARKLSEGFYRVRMGQGDEARLREIDPRSAVVFVMNHRSNMDYVLITWLAADRSALSYAVGEWARVWPLKALIRAMGAYFIRRRYSNALYRAVLARYVQMSVQEGVTQAMFPEGGLSLNGAVGPARKGLLHYIVRDFNPMGERDVVFVPVALNYDRVLEDRVLIKADREGTRRFRVRLPVILGFVAKVLWQKLRGTFQHFGYAAVCYGRPVSLRDFLLTRPDASTETLAEELMGRVRQAVPILPVPLAAATFLNAGGGQGVVSRAALESAAAALTQTIVAQGGWTVFDPSSTPSALSEGLAALVLRGILTETDGDLRFVPGQEQALGFYAASVLQRADEAISKAGDAMGLGGAESVAT